MEQNKGLTTNRSIFVREVEDIISAGIAKAYTAVYDTMVVTYWNVGKRIVEEEQQGQERADYGKQLIPMLAEQLTRKFGKGYGKRNLAYFRLFYIRFKDFEILHARVQNLRWTHFRSLLRVDNDDARYWYMQQASAENWDYRTLDRNIASQYYFRLLQSPKKEAVIQEMKDKTRQFEADKLEYLKNPVVAEFMGLGNNTDFTETALEQAIIDHLQKFLMELGRGFAFVARQQHIATDIGDFFIDLVFYNFNTRSFVLIDLKTNRITHQDVGQIDMYVRMYDSKYLPQGHNPTIGILLCEETSADLARFSILHDNDHLFAAKYFTYMPTQEELKREIERQKAIFRLQQEDETTDGNKVSTKE